MYLLLTKLDMRDMHGKVEVQRLLFEFASNVENKNAFFSKPLRIDLPLSVMGPSKLLF